MHYYDNRKCMCYIINLYNSFTFSAGLFHTMSPCWGTSKRLLDSQVTQPHITLCLTCAMLILYDALLRIVLKLTCLK